MTEAVQQSNNEPTKKMFICGSALKGQPDHQNLQSAIFLKTAKTTKRMINFGIANVPEL